jgi:hypothetical protein
MRVKMLAPMLVTVDGVATIETEAGEEYLMGDGIAGDLIDAGFAEAVEAATAGPGRRRHGEKKPDPAKEAAAKLAAEEAAAKEAADAEEAAAKLAAEEAAAKEAADATAPETKDAGAAGENKSTAAKRTKKK